MLTKVLIGVTSFIITALVVACLWLKIQAAGAVHDLRLAQDRVETLEAAVGAYKRAAGASKAAGILRQDTKVARRVEYLHQKEGDKHALDFVKEWADTPIPESVASRLRE